MGGVGGVVGWRDHGGSGGGLGLGGVGVSGGVGRRRARRPPCLRRIRCANSRSALGRTARQSALQRGSCWRARAASWPPTRTLRPPAAPVQRSRNSQPAHARPERAVSELSPSARVTVPRAKSTSRRSLAKRPPGARAGWVRHLELTRLRCSSPWNSPLPWALSPWTVGRPSGLLDVKAPNSV